MTGKNSADIRMVVDAMDLASNKEHINVFVDGERATVATPLAPGSVVHVIPAVSGGA